MVRREVGVRGVASPGQVRAAAELGGLVIDTAPFADLDGILLRVPAGVRRPDLALVRAGLNAHDAAWVIAHEAGHYYCGHEGNQLYTRTTWADVALPEYRYDREAHVWALTFICGAPAGPRFDWNLREAVEDGYSPSNLLEGLNAARMAFGDVVTVGSGANVSALPLGWAR